jgi:Ni,Fe-hydrogenase III component G
LESGSGELNLRAVALGQRAHKGRYGEIEVLKSIPAVSRRVRSIARRLTSSGRFEQRFEQAR